MGKADMSKTVDFSDDGEQQEPETDGQGAEASESQPDESSLQIEDISTGEKSEVDISESAVTILENDDFIFTSEGVVSKSSIKSEDNSDDNDDSEPEEEKIFGKFDSVEDLKKSYKELEKKLGSSSEAAKQLKELEPVLPLMEAMLNDPNFLDVADSYFNDPEAQKEAILKSLGVEEGFELDIERALSDPKSDDAKVLEKLTARKQQSQQPKNKNQKQNQLSDEDKKAVAEKYGLSVEDVENTLEKAAEHRLSLDDIVFLLNKDTIIEKEKEKAQKKVTSRAAEQSKRARKTNKSSANSSESSQPSMEDMFIQGLQKGNGLFG